MNVLRLASLTLTTKDFSPNQEKGDCLEQSVRQLVSLSNFEFCRRCGYPYNLRRSATQIIIEGSRLAEGKKLGAIR